MNGPVSAAVSFRAGPICILGGYAMEIQAVSTVT